MCVLCYRSPRSKRARVVAEELVEGVVSRASFIRPRAQGAVGVGPRAALQRLGVEEMCGEDKQLWLENARLMSITGACRLSMPSVMSGLRCWISFVGKCSCFLPGLLGALVVLCEIHSSGASSSTFRPMCRC